MDGLPAHERDLLVLRQRAVELVAQGHTMTEAATIVGLHRRTVSRAVRLHAEGGAAALLPRTRGRKPLLSSEQHAALAALAREHRPSELGLRGSAWTRAAAADLVERETGCRVTPMQAGKWLNRWGVERLRGRPRSDA